MLDKQFSEAKPNVQKFFGCILVEYMFVCL